MTWIWSTYRIGQTNSLLEVIDYLRHEWKRMRNSDKCIIKTYNIIVDCCNEKYIYDIDYKCVQQMVIFKIWSLQSLPCIDGFWWLLYYTFGVCLYLCYSWGVENVFWINALSKYDKVIFKLSNISIPESNLKYTTHLKINISQVLCSTQVYETAQPARKTWFRHDWWLGYNITALFKRIIWTSPIWHSPSLIVPLN